MEATSTSVRPLYDRLNQRTNPLPPGGVKFISTEKLVSHNTSDFWSPRLLEWLATISLCCIVKSAIPHTKAHRCCCTSTTTANLKPKQFYLRCANYIQFRCFGTARVNRENRDELIEIDPHAPSCPLNPDAIEDARFKEALRHAVETDRRPLREIYDTIALLFPCFLCFRSVNHPHKTHQNVKKLFVYEAFHTKCPSASPHGAIKRNHSISISHWPIRLCERLRDTYIISSVHLDRKCELRDDDEGNENSEKYTECTCRKMAQEEDDEQYCSIKLKQLRDQLVQIDRDHTNDERAAFLRDQIYPLIENWHGRLPELGDVFQPDEIKWLLSKDARFTGHGSIKCPIVDFAIRTGYKDVPHAWPERVPLLFRRRSTAVHFLVWDHREHLESCETCRRGDPNRNNVVSVLSRLLDIYDRSNYVDSAGLTHFHVACEYGLVDVVDKYLERIDPFELLDRLVPQTGDSALHLALLHDQRRVAELLLRRAGANPTWTNNEGKTSLHIACRNNYDDDFLRLLFESCAEKDWQLRVDARDEEGNTPLHYALRYGSKGSIELLLSRGADPNAANGKGKTGLHIVCERPGCVDDLTKMLFEHRSKLLVDAKDQFGETPLHLALRHGHVEFAALLLRNDSCPTIADEEGETPLHIVCRRYRDGESIRMLFEHYKDEKQRLVEAPLDDEGNTTLHLALGQRNIELAKTLLSRAGADPAVANWKGATPLHICCQKKYPIDATERLLFDHPMHGDQRRALKAVNALDAKGKTPLHYALAEDDAAMAELLLRRGADPSLALHVACEKKFTRHLEKALFKSLNKLNARELERRIDNRNKEGKTPLHLALRNDNLEAAEWLLRRGADPSKAAKNGLIPLHVVCKASPADGDLAKVFFKRAGRRIRVDGRDEEGNAPLHLALNRGNKRTVKLLLKRGADPNLANAEGETPLHVVCSERINDAVELAETLIEYGGDRLRIDAVGKLGRTPLHLALNNGNKRLIELLLKAGADLDSPDAEGETGLHMACRKYDDDDDDNDDILKMIFFKSKSSRIDARNRWGDTPLHLALRNNRKRITKWLLRRGADPNAPNERGQTPLHAMTQPRPRDDRLVKMFFRVSRGSELRIDAQDDEGSAPLHLAVRRGHARALELLLRRGADPNVIDARGATPLHRVCEDRHELAELFFALCDLAREPAQINVRDNEGNAPLHLALRKASRETMELLLRRGADPNLANAQGETPLLQIVRENREVDLIETLLEFSDDEYRPVRMNDRDREGNSPLHLALLRDDCNKWRKVVELLLRGGADPNLTNEEGQTPLHFLCKRHRHYHDLLKIMFDRYDGPVRVNARDGRGNTALHMAAAAASTDSSSRDLIEFLLGKGADPSIANAEGSTPLHIVCRGYRDVESARMLFEHCDDKKRRPRLVDTRDDEGNTPLHLALQFGGRDSKRLMSLLLARGADPNSANEEGSTPVHLVCKRYRDAELVDTFFGMCDELHRKLRLDVRDKSGDTPLHLALEWANERAAEMLLSRGAEPNLLNEAGETPLHVMSKDRYYEDSMKTFFRICDEKRREVSVNVRDKMGNSPLHLALSCGARSSVEALLRRGADPNMTNAQGLTAVQISLEIVDDDDDSLLELLFEICNDIDQTVKVDVQDKLGRTPLQSAVANLSPRAVNLLLDHGADLSSFVFPTETFGEKFQPDFRRESNNFKFKLAAGALACVEHLESRGYELKRDPARAIVKFFAKHRLFDDSSSSDLKRYWYDERWFAREGKLIAIKPSLSLYAAHQLPAEELPKALTNADCFELVRSKKFRKLFPKKTRIYLVDLFERMARGFFRRWALDAFVELTRGRLSLECCEKIVDGDSLTNQDLRNICVAATLLAKTCVKRSYISNV
ncbi:unnamed protein product [Trichogramma brassicae]|uniref:Uncharacterized protein n=1 Tax=Trichogramma brassicae TaxID=86971 RepID=A0A6H5I5C6_9HYME|nr:unnamed protein product [Trichogramma brassicae]